MQAKYISNIHTYTTYILACMHPYILSPPVVLFRTTCTIVNHSPRTYTEKVTHTTADTCIQVPMGFEIRIDMTDRGYTCIHTT